MMHNTCMSTKAMNISFVFRVIPSSDPIVISGGHPLLIAVYRTRLKLAFIRAAWNVFVVLALSPCVPAKQSIFYRRSSVCQCQCVYACVCVHNRWKKSSTTTDQKPM